MFINYRSQPVSKLTKLRPEPLGGLQRSDVRQSSDPRPAIKLPQESLQVAVPQASEGMTLYKFFPALLRLGKALRLRLIPN